MKAAPDDPPTPETEPDNEENSGTEADPDISAGYTYLGQFIDHDLTFDPVSSLQRQSSFDDDPARAIIGDPRNDENVLMFFLFASVVAFRQKLNFKPRDEFLSDRGEFRMSDLPHQAKKART